MRKLLRLLAVAGLLAALTAAPWVGVRAEAGGGDDAAPFPIPLEAGALATVDLDRGARAYAFAAPTGSVYDFCVFPASEAQEPVRVQLLRGGETVGAGEGLLTVLSERLVAGEEYVVELSGAGRVRLEVARQALSRCFDDPISLEAAGDRYAKAIARAGDVHWYSIAATARQPVVLAGVPREDGPRLEAQLFDESGALLAEGTPTTGGACLLDFMPEYGRIYRVRVSAPEGGTGLYEMHVAQGDGGLPEAVVLSETDITLHGRESRRLVARVSPRGAADALFWESSDPDVARVEPDGTVVGRQPGTAVVTVYAAGSVRARCRVEVAQVAVEGVRLLSRQIGMNVGDDVALEWQLLPENASVPRVSFSADPAGVVEVDRGGVVRAVGEGEATITVRTAEGGFADSVSVRVLPAQKRYRALLVGEQSYASGVAEVRPGSVNSVTGMRSMLGALSFGGTKYQIETRLDASRDEVLRAIGEVFGEATAQDVSLFYITCHGSYSGGMTCFQMYDGSVLTAEELRRALEAVPGEIVLLVDCCGSGGVLGRASRPEDILKGVDATFDGMPGPSLFGGSRFRVLASASVDQDSYRISFDADAAESGMATVFARAVCEAGGWSIDRAARSAMRADLNYDNVVTLDELYNYAARRVMWYLTLDGGSAYAQTVQVSPEGDVNSVFERSTE